VLFTENITERKQAEERSALPQRFTHANEGILITTSDGAILDVNNTFTQITGYTRDEVLGRNPRLLNSGRHGKEFYAACGALCSRKALVGRDMEPKQDGRIYAEMLTISAVNDESGEPSNTWAVLRYHTIKEHERQLKQIAITMY